MNVDQDNRYISCDFHNFRLKYNLDKKMPVKRGKDE
jgi:hypothetical protein